MIYIVKKKDGKVIMGSRAYVADKLFVSARTLQRRVDAKYDEDGNGYMRVRGIEFVGVPMK